MTAFQKFVAAILLLTFVSSTGYCMSLHEQEELEKLHLERAEKFEKSGNFTQAIQEYKSIEMIGQAIPCPMFKRSFLEDQQGDCSAALSGYLCDVPQDKFSMAEACARKCGNPAAEITLIVKSISIFGNLENTENINIAIRNITRDDRIPYLLGLYFKGRDDNRSMVYFRMAERKHNKEAKMARSALAEMAQHNRDQASSDAFTAVINCEGTNNNSRCLDVCSQFKNQIDMLGKKMGEITDMKIRGEISEAQAVSMLKSCQNLMEKIGPEYLTAIKRMSCQ